MAYIRRVSPVRSISATSDAASSSSFSPFTASSTSSNLRALAPTGFSQRWGGAVASVVRSRGARVAGLLYELGAEDLQALDRFEGHPFAYERVTRFVQDGRGRRRRTVTYVQPEHRFKAWSPPPGYYALLWRAYARLGFDAAPLALAAGVPS